tara:strand:- start:287 stop:616 length:330 start_codon:yes stop_codon:yes gene_type:complete
MYNKDKQELYGTLKQSILHDDIRDDMICNNYHDRRDMMNTIVMLMGVKRFRRCNKMLKTLSMKFSINQSFFNDIVRIYENYTNERERLTSQELRIYYNYCVINRIVLTH